MIPRLILASTSKYRRRLMADAGFDSENAAPEFEENPIQGIHPLDMIAMFARGKAQSIAHKYQDCMIIGSDQGLVCGDRLYGKPGTVERAIEQLISLRGKIAILATSLAVVYGDELLEYQDRAELHFRNDISDENIMKYVQTDLPLDCAGSFKIESKGVRLFKKIKCNDPSAIQGMPMMKLTEMLISLVPEIDGEFR